MAKNEMKQTSRKMQIAVQKALSRVYPALEDKTLQAYVNNCFALAGEYQQLVARDQVPCYVLDTVRLKQRAEKFKTVFSSAFDPAGFYFAVKSNNHPAVAGTLLGCGFGLDVSSGVELETALNLGAEDIVFSGPGKTDAELTLAVQNSKRVTVLVDSFLELNRLNTIAAGTETHMRIGVRLTTMPKGLWKKFGIMPEDLPLFCETAQTCTHMHLCGIQFHTSWNMSAGDQSAFIRKLGKILANMDSALRSRFSFVDIGGGYWPEQGEWLRFEGTPKGAVTRALGWRNGFQKTRYHNPADPIETFARQLDRAVYKHLAPVLPCRICFEPGRWISNSAMHLFISVVDRKGPDLVICDAGTNAVGWERYETDYCPVLNLSRPSDTEKACHILGSLCTPHDVWGAAYFGEDIQPGDILMIPDQGAYTYSLKQQFIKKLPEVVVI